LTSRVAFVCLLLVTAGCAGAHSAGARRSPGSEAQLAGIHKAALLEPRVKAFEIAAGGVIEDKEQWTAASKINAANAVIAGFKAVGIEVQPLDTSAGSDELEEIRALSDVVMNVAFEYTYVRQFPEKVQKFEYSIGPVNSLLDRSGADALVLVWGVGYVPSTGRNVLNVLVGGPPQQARLGVAIVDRAGEVLWFNYSSSSGSANPSSLTDPDSAGLLARSLISEFAAPKP
jgi:hypothetical protein